MSGSRGQFFKGAVFIRGLFARGHFSCGRFPGWGVRGQVLVGYYPWGSLPTTALITSQTSLKMGHVRSKTRSPGQILGKSYVPS